MAEILVVDDERIVRDGLKARLGGEGFAVRTARDGADALAKIAERRPDLVLLDVMMPKMNGFRVCEEVRRTDGALPVVFLTASDSDGDQVRAIGLGGDDYVLKSAPAAVLLARIGRALSRVSAIVASDQVRGRRVIRVGNVSVDMATLSVTEGGQEVARLTRTEADMLGVLHSANGKPVSIDDIITKLRGCGFSCEDAMVYVHMGNLRRKLGAAGRMIVNHRGEGYAIVTVGGAQCHGKQSV